MGNFGKKQHISGIALTLIASALLVACDTNETKIENSNPDAFTPKGNVVGVLTDSQTGEPVVGAVVDIGIASATTDDTGHFVLYNVPPNTFINNGMITGSYTAVIKTANVTSPINQKSATYTGPRYANYDTTCNFMNVVFTSLAEVSGGTGTSSTNHDTQVNGLVATTQMTIGKMSGSISGVVYDTDGETPVEGAKIDAVVTDNIGEGCPGGTSLISQYDVTTDANGAYSIAGIEAGYTPTIRAYTTDNAKTASNVLPTMIEGRSYDADNGANLILALNDSVGPVLISTSIENNQDIAVDGNPISVVFKFNEAVVSSEYTTNTAPSASTSGVNTIYNDVSVLYNGAKAGNVAHTVSWNTEMTELTVSIPAAAIAQTSSYTVSIAAGQAAGRLTDAAGNIYTQASGVNDTINFTTGGGTDLSGTAPTVAVTNASTVDYNTFPVTVDWLPVAGAASYNVYRSGTIGASTLALELVGNVTTSSFADADKSSSNANGDTGADCDYPTYTTCNNDGTTGNANNNSGAENRGGTGLVSGESAVSYSYTVAAVNANGDEGAMSTAVAVTDGVSPKLLSIAGNAVSDADGDGNCETVTATFNEPVNEALAETAANYTYNLGTTGGSTLTATAAELTSSTTVKVTFADATACATFSDDADNTELFVVAAVTDIAGNAIATDGDTWHEDTATVD